MTVPIWLPMNDSGSVANVRLTWFVGVEVNGNAVFEVNGPFPLLASSGPYGGLVVAVSLTVPGNGALSVTLGSVNPVGSACAGMLDPLRIAHGIWPAIIAIAFGVDGPMMVWRKLSNRAKRSAYCQQ